MSLLSKSCKDFINKALTQRELIDLPNTCQNCSTAVPKDIDLIKIIKAWPQLSNEIKKVIVKIIS